VHRHAHHTLLCCELLSLFGIVAEAVPLISTFFSSPSLNCIICYCYCCCCYYYYYFNPGRKSRYFKNYKKSVKLDRPLIQVINNQKKLLWNHRRILAGILRGTHGERRRWVDADWSGVRIMKATERSFLYLYDKNLRGQFALASPTPNSGGDFSPASPSVIYAHVWNKLLLLLLL